MGKNPNANRDKKKKFTQKDPSAAEKLEALQLEAARRGIEIWELQKEQEEEESESEEEHQIDSTQKPNPKNNVVEN